MPIQPIRQPFFTLSLSVLKKPSQELNFLHTFYMRNVTKCWKVFFLIFLHSLNIPWILDWMEKCYRAFITFEVIRHAFYYTVGIEKSGCSFKRSIPIQKSCYSCSIINVQRQRNQFSYLFLIISKGQFISKCPFGVFKSTKKTMIF